MTVENLRHPVIPDAVELREMNKEQEGLVNHSVASDGRWWRNKGVAMTLLFWPVVIWVVVVTGGLSFGLADNILRNQVGDVGDLFRVVSQHLPRVAFGGVCVGLGFGLPFGVVSILSRREQAVELAQSVEHAKGE